MNIIKVNHLEGNKIKKIYIFAGDLDDIGEDFIDSTGRSIFTEEESKTIRDENIDVEIVGGYLHGDDTISTIKKKIIQYTELHISTKEMYLFGIKQQIIDPSILYNQLTQVDSIDLTKEILCQYLLNIIENGCSEKELESKCDTFIDSSKDVYDFEDFMLLKNIEWNDVLDITIPIGQKMMLKKQYHYTVNPYNCVMMDSIIKSKSQNLLTTQNSNLLFEYGEMCGNNIFICLAEEVLNYSETVSGLNDLNFLNVYFPNLVVKDDIKSKSELSKKKIQLYNEQKKELSKEFDRYNEKVDFLYDVSLQKEKVTLTIWSIHQAY